MYCSTYCSKILISILYIKDTNKDDHFYIKNANWTDSVLITGFKVYAREPVL